ncbi:MAG: LysM peptidoglycan-binding domain-containing protein [Phycisphaerales bacterium]|jgi:lipoprotein-anchoring transpeptidase ErfK/SrfK|nr:LysM peptidoglycan-binding domain-containing protein [Phycisphaerales bacterium]
MSRKQTRISRALIGILGVAIVLGVVAYFHNVNKSRALETNNAPPSMPVTPSVVPHAQPSPAVAPPTSQPAPVVSRTPDVATVAPTSTPPAEAGTLAEGQSKIQAGDLLAGREVLNNLLQGGTLSSTEAATARQAIAQANQTIIFSPKRFPNDPFGGTYVVKPGDNLAKIAQNYDMTWEMLARINGLNDPRKLRAGATLKVIKGPFHAIVTKSAFTIDMYLGSAGEKGSMYITTYNVGLGRNDSTPTGSWLVMPQNKLKNPKFWGASDLPPAEADDPKNPLGEYWIGLEGTDGHAVGKQSYGIHGTIEPDSIGKQESHGCIRLRNGEIDMVYEMLVEGKSTVIVKD